MKIKRTMRTILGALLISLVGTALAQSESRVLHVFSYAVPEAQQEAWHEVFDAFEAEFGVEVEARFQGEWSETTRNLQASRLAREPVDITNATATLVGPTLAPSGLLMDLTDLVKPIEQRFVPGMLEFYRHGGHIWAVPLGASSTSLVFYNADMFSELGISEPTTFADLVAAVKTVESAKGIQGMIHQGKHPWYWPMWFFETFAQTSGNNSIQYTMDFLSGNRSFDSPEEVAAFAAIGRFLTDGVLDSSVLDVDTEGMRAAFAQQRTAMFYGGLWELPAIKGIVGDDFKIGVFEFPLVVDTPGAFPQHGGGPDDGWGIPSFAPPENIDIQAQFLEFITRPEQAGKVIATFDPYIPTIVGVEPIDDPLAAEINAEFVPHTIQYLDWMWPVEVNDAVSQVIPAVLVGAMTPEAAAKQVQKAYEQVVEEKAYQFNWWDAWSDADWAKVTPSAIPDITVE